MKSLLTTLAILICLTASAQTVKDSSGNYHAQRSETAKPTGKTFTDSKGVVYPLLISARGKLFYLRTSKTGNIYKVYIKN